MLVCPGAVDRRDTVYARGISRTERLGCRQGFSRKGDPRAPLGYMDYKQRFRVARCQGHKRRADPSTFFPLTLAYLPLDHTYRLVIITYAVLIAPYCQGRTFMVLTVYLRVLGPDLCGQSRPRSSMVSVFYSVCDSLLPFQSPNATYRLALCSREAEQRFSLWDFFSHRPIRHSIQSRAYYPSPSHSVVCRAVAALGA